MPPAISRSNQRSVAGILDMVPTVAAMVGASDRADQFVRDLERRLAEARKHAERLKRRPRVFFEEWDDPLISGIGWVSEHRRLRGPAAAGPRVSAFTSANIDKILAVAGRARPHRRHRYSVSTVSSVRHTTRLGGNVKPSPIPFGRRRRHQLLRVPPHQPGYRRFVIRRLQSRPVLPILVRRTCG
jgi:hypothetical protein